MPEKLGDIIMPSLGEKCESCPVFDKCSAMAGMRAVASLVGVATEDKPQAPWARKKLNELENFVAIVSDAAAGCEGPVTKTLKHRPFMANSCLYVTEGSSVRRRPVHELDNPDAEMSVNLVIPNGGAFIKDVERSKKMKDVNFPSYEVKFPDIIYTESPFGNISNEQSNTVRDAAKHIINVVITHNNYAMLDSNQLRQLADKMEEEEDRRTKDF